MLGYIAVPNFSTNGHAQHPKLNLSLMKFNALFLSEAYSDYYPNVAVEGIDIECLNACQEKHYTITG